MVVVGFSARPNARYRRAIADGHQRFLVGDWGTATNAERRIRGEKPSLLACTPPKYVYYYSLGYLRYQQNV